MLTGVDCEAPPPTTLSEAEVMALTQMFIFGDSSGAKATGPTGAAGINSLGLVKVCLAVRDTLRKSRKGSINIKLLLCDDQGRFAKQDLLGHIVNNALGRPILHHSDTLDVGQAADNAAAKEKKETSDAKNKGDAAIAAARAAAIKDPSQHLRVAAAEAAKKAALAAVLVMTYDLKLKDATVGEKRKQAPVVEPSQREVRAWQAVQAAEDLVERKRRSLDQLGPAPVLQPRADELELIGEANAYRRHERKQATFNVAQAAVAAAERAVSSRRSVAIDLGLVESDEEGEELGELSREVEATSEELQSHAKFVELIATDKTAALDALQALGAPFSETWLDWASESNASSCDAHMRVVEAWGETLAPLRAAHDAFEPLRRECEGGWSAAGRVRAIRLYGEQEQAWACVKRVNVLFNSLVAEAGQLRALHSERRADSYRSYFAWDTAQIDARHREYCGCVCDAHCCNMSNAKYECRQCLVGRKCRRSLEWMSGYFSA